MKNNILLSLIFTSIITVSTVTDAKKMLPPVAQPTDSTNKLTVNDIKIIDVKKQIVTADQEIQAEIKKFVDAVNQTQTEIDTLIKFLQSKGIKEFYNDPSKKLTKKDFKKATDMSNRINQLIQGIERGLQALLRKVGTKNFNRTPGNEVAGFNETPWNAISNLSEQLETWKQNIQ